MIKKTLISCPMCGKHELIIFDCEANYDLSDDKRLTFPTKVGFCPILANKGNKDCYFIPASVIDYNVESLRKALKERSKCEQVLYFE